MRPEPGMMLFWRNLQHGTGEGDPRTLHRGEVVARGTKLACNLWITERPFELYRTSRA